MSFSRSSVKRMAGPETRTSLLHLVQRRHSDVGILHPDAGALHRERARVGIIAHYPEHRTHRLGQCRGEIHRYVHGSAGSHGERKYAQVEALHPLPG